MLQHSRVRGTQICWLSDGHPSRASAQHLPWKLLPDSRARSVHLFPTAKHLLKTLTMTQREAAHCFLPARASPIATVSQPGPPLRSATSSALRKIAETALAYQVHEKYLHTYIYLHNNKCSSNHYRKIKCETLLYTSGKLSFQWNTAWPSTTSIRSRVYIQPFIHIFINLEIVNYITSWIQP